MQKLHRIAGKMQNVFVFLCLYPILTIKRSGLPFSQFEVSGYNMHGTGEHANIHIKDSRYIIWSVVVGYNLDKVGNSLKTAADFCRICPLNHNKRILNDQYKQIAAGNTLIDPLLGP